MSQFSAWQFVLENAAVVALFVSGCFTLGLAILLQELQVRSNRKTQRQGVAACWLATLSELSAALDRMQETTHHLIRDRQRPPRVEDIHKSDVLLHQWLREGYLLKASDQDGTALVTSLHKDIVQFTWNVNQATNTRIRRLEEIDPSELSQDKLQRLVELFDGAAIRLTCNRHNAMVDTWKRSFALLNGYCTKFDLDSGHGLVVPGDIPRDWQMDESKPWTIKGLAPVGEDQWEPSP